MGYSVYDRKVLNIELTAKKQVINTINPHSYYVAKKDIAFKTALLNSDILLPDGIGITFAAKILKGKRIKRIPGSDLHIYFLEKLNQTRGVCFYLGASEDTLLKIKEKLHREYPDIASGFYSPPFKQEFTENENKLMIQEINKIKPDVLFVGMTAPKQEKWVYQNHDNFEAKAICSIGAVFDFYAGTVDRPQKWMIKYHLEWLGRLFKNPRRLWKRTFISAPVFLFDVFLLFIRTKLFGK
jgi:N-acetylglucosaminyldiphosphoundecaprenol N-acetyl-beta-D-mannosaminyltransferase